ncbi:hypothetical protein B0O99DRAFT_94762 [Bisporella sp. PMI_857]|nr:hypothetical protein B0O99DRAFT_94762 [Bisporella sp. PMI_857]
MASATGIPAQIPPQDEERGEDEPLLGRPGDLAPKDGEPLWRNFFSGTAVLTQTGLILLVASVWASVFLHPLILFSAHPLLNSGGLLLLTQGILILQPTHTADQKRRGTFVHANSISLALALLVAGLIVIEYNKFSHRGIHFASAHAILGLTQYYFPGVYGGVDRAKSVYKYHRWSGYAVLTLLLATVAAATQTDYNKNVLHIKLWAVLLSAVLLLLGVIPRIKKQKLGIANVKPLGIRV